MACRTIAGVLALGLLAWDPSALALRLSNPSEATPLEPDSDDAVAPKASPPSSASPAVGSLPPLSGDAVPARTSLPLFMLPSSVNVVTHAAGSTEDDPRARPQCRKIERVVENGPRRNRDTSDFAAFQAIISTLMGNGTEPTEEWVRNPETGELEKVDEKDDKQEVDPETGEPIEKKQEVDPETGEPMEKKEKVDPETGEPIKKGKIDPETGEMEKDEKSDEGLTEFGDEDWADPEQDDMNDKLISNSMFTIERGHSVSGSLDWNLVASLRNCAVDKYGRTMFMKMVRRGYVTSLGTAASRSLAGAKLYNLRDTLQNNIIHLAVMSKNKVVLQQVKGLLGADRARLLMDMKNLAGKTPVELAIDAKLIDMVDFLKTTFSAVSAAQFSGHRSFSSNGE